MRRNPTPLFRGQGKTLTGFRQPGLAPPSYLGTPSNLWILASPSWPTNTHCIGFDDGHVDHALGVYHGETHQRRPSVVLSISRKGLLGTRALWTAVHKDSLGEILSHVNMDSRRMQGAGFLTRKGGIVAFLEIVQLRRL